MLSGIRTFSKSIFAKVLFGIIAISFVAWGLNASMLSLGNSREVAEVGSQSISPAELDRAFKRNIDKMRRVFGPGFDQQQAIQMGLLNNTVQGLVSQKLLEENARDMGIGISDDKVRDNIFNNKSFKDETTGQFDRQKFLQILYQNGYSEPEFIEGMRSDLMSQQVVGSLSAASTPPSPLVKAIAAYRNEDRSGRFITLGDDDIAAIETPSDDVLKKFHDDHSDQFTAPETRNATLALLTVDHLAQTMDVTDDEVLDAYNQRIGEFQTPEKRAVEQILFAPNDKESASEAYKALQGGEDFMKVATEQAGMKESVVKLGEFTKDNMLPDLRDTVFGLPEGGYSEPVETALGWHIMRVTSITPAHEQSLDEVREQVENGVKRQKAEDQIFDIAAQLDDELGAGTSLKDAAAKVNAQLFTLTDIKKGQDLGQGIVDSKEINSKIYELNEGDESFLEETQNGNRYVVSVTKVTPSAVQPFDDVRDAVETAWKADEKQRLLGEKADALAARINDQGAKIDDIAAELDNSIDDTGMTKRDGRGLSADANPAIAGALFNLAQGKAQSVVGQNGVSVVVLDTIKPAGDTTGKDDPIVSELQDSLDQDIVSQYLDYLRDDISISLNNGVVNGLYAQNAPAN
ncbi:SurA N-terminal domain-containing protein [Thalassospira sp. MCCC 1A01428]|uniref:SurA N-terminal domain-containing protein n=1 Tax=Thalassospira sp. MCCC 1A01428 TaxID=1470575 RepID=UPI000A20010C|nr:SurA N-terminal domain-containing protein [Thalassospira sp. MCCC 1A01428]OSQ35289.1 peptidylprolyl isomerase [Thalassospira sp. MCCC 1A01428]